MRSTSKNIFEMLENAHGKSFPEDQSKSGFNSDGTSGVRYTNKFGGVEYAAIHQWYASGGDTYSVEVDGRHVTDKIEKLSILERLKQYENAIFNKRDNKK